MFFGWRASILLEFKAILQSLDLSLKIVNNNLVFPVNFGFVVLFAEADATVELFYHAISPAVKVADVCIFNGNSFCVSVSYTVDDCI